MSHFDPQNGPDWGDELVPGQPQTQRVQAAAADIRRELGKLIIGQRETIDLLLAGVLAGGHVLLEGVPGIAKTLTAKLLARSLSVQFSRMQFTPDLMPSDVLGTTVFNMQSSAFHFRPGPVFANFVLIDEINRAPAKTQAALFEVMEERQVSVDGETHILPFPFFVIATQNPIEQEGTYKLPEAQLDRFLFKIQLGYPNLEEEGLILRRFRDEFSPSLDAVRPVLDAEGLFACRQAVEKIAVKDDLLHYIAQIVHRTRQHADLYLGASPRASLAILRSAKAVAAMQGRAFVTPDDIRYVALPVLNHRIILTPEREMEGYEARDVIEDIIRQIDVPR